MDIAKHICLLRDMQNSFRYKFRKSFYVLAMAISVPLSGWAVQRFNGKWLMIGANVLFLAASIASGLSWSINSMIIFRIVQGFSAGFIMTLVTTLCVEIAGWARMGRLMSTIGIPTVLGPILGPVIGAVIVQFLSWRFIFFVNIPIGILAIALMILKLPGCLQWYGQTRNRDEKSD